MSIRSSIPSEITVLPFWAAYYFSDTSYVVVPAGSTDQYQVALPAGDHGPEAAIAIIREMLSPPTPERAAVDAAADQTARRAGMVCSRLQGRLTLGPDICARLDAMAADPEMPWAMREIILNAAQWHRQSQTIDELAWMLGFEPAQMDQLFEAAMKVDV